MMSCSSDQQAQILYDIFVCPVGLYVWNILRVEYVSCELLSADATTRTRLNPMVSEVVAEEWPLLMELISFS